MENRVTWTTYHPSNPIAGESLGTPEAWSAYAREIGADHIEELDAYFQTMYEFAPHPEVQLGAHKLIAESAHETAELDPATGRYIPWTSDAWDVLNPAGIGVTGPEKRRWHHFGSGRNAALAHLVRACKYVKGYVPDVLKPYEHLDPRGPVPASVLGQKKTLESWGDDDWRNNPTWAATDEYGQRWADQLNALRHVFLTADPETPEEETDVSDAVGKIIDTVTDIVEGLNDHRYGIGMGHRNENRGGAWGEIDWTPECARALKAAIEARGGEAHLFQEHDGDSDPNFSRGKGLQAAARVGSDTVVNRYGPLTAIFFCHYNGGLGAGAHFIYPDGWVAPDRGVDNSLDVRLATAIKRHLAKTNTVGFLGWNGWQGPERGVMSERDSGAVANRWGYRLGEMVGTIQHRSVTPRLIIEAGSIDTGDRRYITNPTWVRHVYAEAICDALEEVFGPMPKGKPEDTPDKPESVYATPIERKWADDAIESGVTFVKLPDKNHKAGYTRWWRVDRNYITTEAVARQQVATDSSRFLNEPIPAGTPIWVDFVGENWKGDPYGLTPWGTMVRMDNLRVIDWPNQPDLHATLEE